MNQSKYAFYCTGLHKSKYVGSYVCQALQKLSKPVESFCFEDTPIVYGVLAGAGDIIRKCRMARLPYIHIDNGYFKSGYPDGFYRITKNAERGYVDYMCTRSWRFQELGLVPKPMRAGELVVLCAPSELGCFATPYDKLTPKEWVQCMTAYVRSEGLSHEIVVTHKQGGEYRLPDVIDRADWVIGCSSNTIVDALMHGVRARDMAPWLPFLLPTERSLHHWEVFRADYFNRLAYHQMKLSEFTRERIENACYSD